MKKDLYNNPALKTGDLNLSKDVENELLAFWSQLGDYLIVRFVSRLCYTLCSYLLLGFEVVASKQQARDCSGHGPRLR